MKRATPPHKEEELPFLPDDVVLEILLYAFHGVGEDTTVTTNACRARRTSPRIRNLIDTHLFGKVRKLSHDVLYYLINEKNLLLFYGLKKLKVFERCPRLNESTLMQMTSLESLTLFSSDRVGDRSIQALTNLRRLILYAYDGSNIGEGEKKHITEKSLCMLTRLDTLIVCSRTTITDKCIALLPQLRRLDLRRVPIEGDCFTSLTRLERLYISRTNVKEDSLKSLVRLRRLSLDNNKALTNKSLSALTGLVKLNLAGDEDRFSDAVLQPFKDTLEVIKLDYHSRVNWASLKECANLKEVHLEYFEHQMKTAETQENIEKERGIKFLQTPFCPYL